MFPMKKHSGHPWAAFDPIIRRAPESSSHQPLSPLYNYNSVAITAWVLNIGSFAVSSL